MAFLSSSPVPAHHRQWSHGSLFGPAATSSSPVVATFGDAHKNGSSNGPAVGQLSPSFDSTFAHSMNISAEMRPASVNDGEEGENSEEYIPKSSPHLMDVSPAAPAFKLAPIQTSRAVHGLPPILPALHLQPKSAFLQPSSRTAPTSNTVFDQSFFRQLARQPSHPPAQTITNSTLNQTVSNPLVSKDINTMVTAKLCTNAPLKRPTGLLRTASAKADPFQLSPRPPIPLERSYSDNAAVGKDGGLTLRATSARQSSLSGASIRRPISGASRVRVGIPADWTHGRSHTEPAAPSSNYATSRPTSPSLFVEPPVRPIARLHHTISAPATKPSSLGRLDLRQSASDSAVPTRRTLATESGSRLAREVMNAHSDDGNIESSPGGMDVDGCSPYPVRTSSKTGVAVALPSENLGQAISASCSPGLSDLFEGGAELVDSSPTGPVYASQAGRKRGMEEADSSFASSAGGDSPVKHSRHPSQTDRSNILMGLGTADSAHAALPSTFGKAAGQRALARAASSNGLASHAQYPASKRRGSGQGSFSGGSSAFLAALTAAAAAKSDAAHDNDPDNEGSGRSSSSSRHRKASRGPDGRPRLVGRSQTTAADLFGLQNRRAHSMCDSEFYASPPLATVNDATTSNAAGYFQAGSVNNRQSLGIISPANAASPVRITVNSVQGQSKHLNNYQPSPEASFTSGFGHKESQGKILPCFPVKEDGLMRVTASTLNDLLTGVYDDFIHQYVVIDCRFDYEFDGGHVEGAINLRTAEAVEQFLLSSGDECLHASAEELPLPSKSGCLDTNGEDKKTILVFHCEFSAKRAPTLAKYLRSKDRALNHAAYPAVHYPEVYVLQGGYAECWKQYPERCEPRGYVQMDDPRHLTARANDLGQMRRKRMGIRAKSYTFGESMFAGPNPSNAAVNRFSAVNASSRSGTGAQAGLNNASRPSASSLTGFNSSLFNGVISSAQLCVHEEEHEGHDGMHGSPVGIGRQANMLGGPQESSSPCAGPSSGLDSQGGDSPCLSGKVTRPQLLRAGHHANSFPMRPGSFARTLQRANTSANIYSN